jgi:hypothetical protein
MSERTGISPNQFKTMNDAADFWRNSVGVNVIGANTKEKVTYESWKKWQDKAIPQELHDQWKASGAFNNGIAIILGKVYHNKQKEDLYLIGIDCDNAKAIEEICTSKDDKTISLVQLAESVIVEQHLDDPTKAHILFYSHKPFPKKSSDNSGPLAAKINTNEIPAIEVKGLGSHGIFFVSPSIHRNGYPYQIIGTNEPDIIDDFDQYLNRIFKKYSISYLDVVNDDSKSQIPIEDLFKPDYTVAEGHNRHEDLLRVMESLIVRNSAILSLQKIKDLAKEWNSLHCIPPLGDKEFEKQSKCALDFIDRKKKQGGEQQQQQLQPSISTTSLDLHIPDRDYAEYVIKIIKKTVKREDSLVRQILYSALSANSKDPINLGIIAPTSEGKTYPVIETLKFFPKEDVWLIGSMSTKLLVRQKGILVDENNEPIKPAVVELKKQINDTDDEDEKERLKNRLQELFENARTLIDLRDKILVFLEPPHHDLWSLLKPILSHDSKEIEFPFVDKTEKGLVPRRVIVRGWPACIFCSARDESNWPVWPEIQSRFLITSPNMIPEKYHESNLLIAQRKGLPALVQQKIIVSDEEVKLASTSILYLKQEIKKLSTSINNNGSSITSVWIPYLQYLAEALPSDKGTDTRAINRIFSILNIIPLAKSNLRLRLIYGSEILVVATLEDLAEVLHITQNLNGMPTYKMKFFKEIFFPLYTEKAHEPLTTKELCEYFKTKYGKAIDSDSMKKKYLNELRNNGIIGEEDSPYDRRQKTYTPLIEPSSSYFEDERKHVDQNDYQKMSNYRKTSDFDNFLQYSRITLPKCSRDIPEDWLIFEILGLAKCRIDLDNFAGCIADLLNQTEKMKFFNTDNRRMSIREFTEEYQKNSDLRRYFRKRGIHSFHSNIFGDIKYIGRIYEKTCNKLSLTDKTGQIDTCAIGTHDNSIAEVTSAAATNISQKDDTSTKNRNIHDNLDSPSEPPFGHSLQESPYYSIIETAPILNRTRYTCKLHPERLFIDLPGVEHHCKYDDPDLHKFEALRSTSKWNTTISSGEEAA